MNKEQATKEIRQMIDREFSHQSGNEYIQVEKDYLVDMIVKQMEHAIATNK